MHEQEHNFTCAVDTLTQHNIELIRILSLSIILNTHLPVEVMVIKYNYQSLNKRPTQDS